MYTKPEFAALDGRAVHRATWLFVAGRAEAIETVAPWVTKLATAGHRVRFAYLEGQASGVDSPVRRRRATLSRDVPRRARRAAGALEALLPDGLRMQLVSRRDSWFVAAVSGAERVLLLDEVAKGAQRSLRAHNPSARLWGPSEVAAVLEEERWWRYLDHRLHQMSTNLLRPLRTNGLMEAVRWLGHREPWLLPPPSDLHRHARSAMHRLTLRGRLDDAREILELCRRAERDVPVGDEEATFRAVEMHLRLHDELVEPGELDELLTTVFSSADAALEARAMRDCAGRASIAIDLMFHPRLHTDVPSTPLVESPQRFTAPLRQSRVGELLTSPTGSNVAVHDTPPPVGEGRAVKVTYLPGSYPWHASRVISALDADPRVDLSVLQLKEPAFQAMALGEFFVSYRLRRAVGGDLREPASPEELAELARADVVVADWADKGALWASVNLPPGARLVLRVHSADVLSAGIHLVDWSRVDDLICVSEHLRQIVLALLGDRAQHLNVHVVPNLLAPFPAEDSNATPSRAAVAVGGRTLAMVGWAQKVKDPIMALDILASLLEREPGWRLRLIGSDFGPSSSALVNDYIRAFRRRSVEPDLLDAIDYVGQTSDVPGALAGSAFILSTSLRESFHIGAMEGIVAGAVPVVREWPAFARYQGASGLFPKSAIFETVDDAVDIIWSLRDPDARHSALLSTQGSMRSVLDGRNATRQILDVILR
ncbi:hypothetical protein [Intrasporangium sp.]|uniref:hypothetical protein n=1 Tax=Intrasporangium sp. TaxID=1925024 RepID=UPI002939DFB3|nr:hypothetical protein [Intrasporangium sp.]MDV3219824.1 hypothetical protein [Intrasporangium sp.]